MRLEHCTAVIIIINTTYSQVDLFGTEGKNGKSKLNFSLYYAR